MFTGGELGTEPAGEGEGEAVGDGLGEGDDVGEGDGEGDDVGDGDGEVPGVSTEGGALYTEPPATCSDTLAPPMPSAVAPGMPDSTAFARAVGPPCGQVALRLLKAVNSAAVAVLPVDVMFMYITKVGIIMLLVFCSNCRPCPKSAPEPSCIR